MQPYFGSKCWIQENFEFRRILISKSKFRNLDPNVGSRKTFQPIRPILAVVAPEADAAATKSIAEAVAVAADAVVAAEAVAAAAVGLPPRLLGHRTVDQKIKKSPGQKKTCEIK